MEEVLRNSDCNAYRMMQSLVLAQQAHRRANPTQSFAQSPQYPFMMHQLKTVLREQSRAYRTGPLTCVAKMLFLLLDDTFQQRDATGALGWKDAEARLACSKVCQDLRL